MTPRVKENPDEFGSCACGRSPTKKCMGWHGLSEEKYQQALSEYLKKQEQEQLDELNSNKD